MKINKKDLEKCIELRNDWLECLTERLDKDVLSYNESDKELKGTFDLYYKSLCCSFGDDLASFLAEMIRYTMYNNFTIENIINALHAFDIEVE